MNEPATIVARKGSPKSANGCFCSALRYLAASELGSVALKDFEENCIVAGCTVGWVCSVCTDFVLAVCLRKVQAGVLRIAIDRLISRCSSIQTGGAPEVSVLSASRDNAIYSTRLTSITAVHQHSNRLRLLLHISAHQSRSRTLIRGALITPNSNKIAPLLRHTHVPHLSTSPLLSGALLTRPHSFDMNQR